MSFFRRRPGADTPFSSAPAPIDRVTSVLGPATIVKGRLSGSGGVRIEGAFEGEISIDGLLVIGENGKVTSQDITATVVVIAGVVKGDITAEKVEIRATGRVWGDITTSAFATQEGAFLRGQVRMEEQIELEFLDETEGPGAEKAGGEEGALAGVNTTSAGLVESDREAEEYSADLIEQPQVDAGNERGNSVEDREKAAAPSGGDGGEAEQPAAANPSRPRRTRKKQTTAD